MDFCEAYRGGQAKIVSGRMVPGEYFALQGGLDLATPPLRVDPGALIGCLNYEAKLNGGYESLKGYERMDGRPQPSQAPYWLVPFAGQVPTADPTVGSVLSAASGGNAIVLQLVDPDDDGNGYLVVGRLTGTFTPGTVLSGSNGFTATLGSAPTSNSANEDEDHENFRNLAIEDQRSIISAVPGSGRVLGVVIYRGVTYALRNNSGGTAAVMYRSTPSGWQAINLGVRVHFTAGQAAGIAAGNTLTGNTSGATGTVRRVVIQSGTFAANTAAGYLILSGVAGTFTNTESLRVVGTNRATANGDSLAQTLAPNGRFEFRVHNFYGASGTLRLYGCDGVNRAFEYQDGGSEFFCPVFTGMPIDAPLYLAVFDSHLWLAFPRGSIQFSSINDPVVWNAVLGAAEIGLGDEPTGFLEQTKTLFAFSRNRSDYFQVDGAGGYIHETFNPDSGALPWAMQNIGSGLYLDDRGFGTVATTQRFGSFQGNSVSFRIDSLVKELRPRTIASATISSKNRYRCFFDDGQFLSATVRDTKVIAWMRCDYGRPVRCVWSGEDANGAEKTVFGSDDGFVYVADAGTSFDGAPITTFLRLPFNHSKSPGRVKRYRRADFDISVDGRCSIFFGVDYSYARPEVTSDPTRTISVLAGGGFWDISKWDEFRWNAGFVGQAPIKLEGSGENVSILFSSESARQAQHSIDGVMLRYSNRRLERRATP